MWCNVSSQQKLIYLTLDSYIVYYVITLAEEQGAMGGQPPKVK